MKEYLRPALAVFLILTVVTGLAYPFLITGLAQVFFPHQANGSPIVKEGKVVGSELIGQPFDQPKYFWGRPSATSPAYNAAASTGSNLGPTNPGLLEAIEKRVKKLEEDKDHTGPVPADLVMASGSGLDPHISPAAAEYQVKRVAKARELTEERVRALVARHTEGRTFGVLGEARVNVLSLNLALDQENQK